MPDRVLVTGISGFVGGHVALQLLEAGYLVRGSVRDPGRADKVRDTLGRHGADLSRLEFVTLDLLRDGGWAEAVADARYLQHVASPFIARAPRHRDDLIRPAVEGTTRALEAAFGAGVERAVVTSSMAAVMYGHDPARSTPFTAADWTDPDAPGISAYIESKARAERAAWALADRLGRRSDLAAINPGLVFGPLLDEDPGTSAQFVVNMLRGVYPMIARIPQIIIDVRDVAALHVKAMTAPEAGGRRFPAGVGTHTLLEVSEMLRPAFPDYAKRLPRGEVPDWLVRLIGPLVPDLRDNMAEISSVRRVDASDALALLGRPFISARDTVVETGRTAIANGLV